MSAAEIAVVPRAFVRVAGPDAEAYLQGQLSQDVDRPHGSSLLLEPTGKVVALLRFVREADDSFLLDTDPEAGDALLARLRRFLLRTKATIEPVDGLVCTRFLTGAPPDAIGAVWPGAGVRRRGGRPTLPAHPPSTPTSTSGDASRPASRSAGSTSGPTRSRPRPASG